MATRLLTTSSTISGSAGLCKKADFVNLSVSYSSTNYDDINTARYGVAFNPTVGVSLQGVFLSIRRAAATTGTFTVSLEENVTGTWTQRAISATLNVSSVPSETCHYYIPFSAGYTATANQFRIKFVCNTASRMYWWRSTTAGDYSFAVIGNGDDATGLTTGDTVLIDANVTLTVDTSFTFANTKNVVIGPGATLFIPNPASPITVDFGNSAPIIGLSSNFKVGTSASRIGAAKVTILSSLSAATNFFVLPYISYGGSIFQTVVEMYGNISTDLRLKIASDSAIGQGTISTVESIPASWTVGDTIVLAAKDQTSADASEYTIQSKSSNSVVLNEPRTATMTIANPCVVTISAHGLVTGDFISFATTGALPTGVTAGTVYYVKVINTTTFNLYDTYANAIAGGTTGRVTTSGTQSGTHTATIELNLTVKALKYGGILNLSEAKRNLGIQFKSTNTIFLGVGGSSNLFDHYIYDGIYFENTVLKLHNDTTTSSVPSEVKNIFNYVNHSGGAYTNGFWMEYKGGGVVSNVHQLNKSVNYTLILLYGKNCTISNVTIRGLAATSSTGYAISGNNNNISDVISANAYGTSLNNFWALSLAGSAMTLNDINVIGQALMLNGVNRLIASNITQQRGVDYGLFINNCFGTLTDCKFGIGNTNPTADIYHVADTFSQLNFVNPEFSSTTPISSNFVNMVTGSYLRCINYGGVLDDMRSWYRQGTFTSTNPGLISQQALGTETLINSYNVGSRTISGIPMGVLINTKINNAAYYAGTYTLPNLVVNVDGADRSAVSASASTSQQQLEDVFTPAEDNNDLAIKLSTKTDATGTNANVYWDTLAIRQRLYGKTFTEIIYDTIQTTDVIIASINNVVDNPFITVSNKATVQAYTGISIDDGTSTITITENHSLNELYDFVQAYCSDDFTLAEIISTLDGVTFSCIYDVVISGCALDGSGKIFNLGSKTLTKSGGGTFNGTSIDSAGRYVPIYISGIVAGSTIQIYDTTESIEYYNGVVSGTSLLISQLYDEDETLRIRARKAGYEPYENTFLRTSVGASLTINQVIDDVYVANGIDGSTVTEFSLIDGNLLIYISDADNKTTAQRMYNWYQYIIATTSYIGEQPNLVIAQTPWSYIFDDTIQMYNQKVDTLFMTGANINNQSNTGDVIDDAGGKININGYFPFSSLSDVAVANRVEMDSNSTKLKTIVGLSAAAASK